MNNFIFKLASKIQGMKRYFVSTLIVCLTLSLSFAQKSKSAVVKRAPIDTSKFVLVEGGTYKMGSDKPVEPHEAPVHEVTVKSFYLAKTEVTFEELDKFCNETKRDTSNSGLWGRSKQAAMNLTWLDAVAYCNWLSEKEKLSKCYLINGTEVKYLDTSKGYRLPTEAEWEFAARGGNKSKGNFFAGSDVINEVAWFKGNSNDSPHLVAQKKPNELGLFDMTGNMWEWVWDWYAGDYYKTSPNANPTGAETGNYRIMRGGAFYNDGTYANVYTRQNASPNFKQNSVGFRVARTYY